MPPLGNIVSAPTSTVPLCMRTNALSTPCTVSGVEIVAPASRVTATLSTPAEMTRR